MAFDAYCYSVSHKEKLLGETQDEAMSEKNAFEIISFELGAENNINMGSMTGGGAAGKAVFKEFTLTKKTDNSSTYLFHALCTGEHMDDLVVEQRRGQSGESSSGVLFMSFQMYMVMVQDISWSGSDGDDVCEESVILQYGAIKIHYYAQDSKGKMAKAPKEAMWSRIKNKASISV